jgi:hypothetical protein
MSKFFEPIVIKDPPSEYEFMIEPPSISAYDLYDYFSFVFTSFILFSFLVIL